MRAVLMLVLLFPVLAFGRDHTIGKRALVDAVFCLTERSALNIGKAYAHKGLASAQKLLTSYSRGEKFLCIEGVMVLTLEARIHHIKGKFGTVNVYRATPEDGTRPIFIPVAEVGYMDQCGSNCL